MGEVVPFRLAPTFTCRTVTTDQVHADVAFLNSLLEHSADIACPSCCGRGQMLYKNPTTGLLDAALCPCGGTDEDRIPILDCGGAA